MLFNSYEFIFLFLPLAVICHFQAARWSSRAAAATTTVSSLIFYAWWKPPYVILLVLSMVGNYGVALWIAKATTVNRRRLLWLGISANILLLGFYKYLGFFLPTLVWAQPEIPLALSFTTFVQIAFLIETSRTSARVPPVEYAMFVSFFPHLIAGPIVRWKELGRQILDKTNYQVNWNNVALGLTIFCLGLSKKVILADTLAPHIAPVFDAATNGVAVPALAAWGAAIAFTLQIYYDFSGYSDMAIGLGLLFNLRLPINFAAPLRSTNITDLWRRWHLSLMRFLRDFVYMPLSLFLVGRGNHPATSALLAIFVTMVIGGLWHGANWTFVAWGAFHGCLLIFNHFWRRFRGDAPVTPGSRTLGWFLTFTAFVVGGVFFRSSDIDAAGRLLLAMTGFGDPPSFPLLSVARDDWAIRHGFVSEQFVRSWFGAYWSVASSLTTLGVLVVALLVPDTIELTDYREGDPQLDWRRSTRLLAWRTSPMWGAVLVALFGLVFVKLATVTEFLYYQF